ncbi:MAG: nuclear transport factor 2 family protein [Xanthobacteraceae bacterium]
MDTEVTRVLAKRLYEVYSRGNRDEIAALIHDDIDWIIHAPIDVFPFVGPRHGKAAVLKTIEAIGTEYKLLRYIPEIIIADGDRAAVLSNVAFEKRASGRTLSFRIANFLRFRDGLLVDLREFSDTFDVTQQALGRWLQV